MQDCKPLDDSHDEDAADPGTCEELKLDDLDVAGDKVVCKLKPQCCNQQGTWIDLGEGEITMDSAADESCWPASEGGAFEV